MTRLWPIPAIALALVVGWAWGRHGAPAREQVRESSGQQQQSAAIAWDWTAGHQSLMSSASAVVEDTTVEETTSDGRTTKKRTIKRTTAAEKKQEARQEQAAGSAKAETAIQWKDREVLRIVDRTPRWGLGAVAGMGYDGSREYGGTASVRVLGPIELGAVVTNRAALLTVGARW